jgi:hypothetical protein
MPNTSTTSQTPTFAKPNADVIFRRLGDEIVLFHLETDKFYELNGTAARFWELLQSGHDTTQIKLQMLGEFAVDPVCLASEVEALLKSLSEEDLITLHE